MSGEFEEIGHSGGKVTFNIATSDDGRRSYQVGISSSRPVPTVLVGVYALPEGVPVGSIQLGGIGQPWNPPPFPECLPVLIASDSQGKFGHTCPQCSGYWRSGPWPNVCPYCYVRADGYQFLSEAQLKYVWHYCDVLCRAIGSAEYGTVEIDMDEVAEAVGKEHDKPAFYIAEESQQRKYNCPECDEFNDILGRYAYCSLCGTRNDFNDFRYDTLTSIRDRINSGSAPEDCVRDSVSAFDSLTAQIGKQFAALVPLSKRRAHRLTKKRYHNLNEVRSVFREWFDIDIGTGISDSDWEFCILMFHRRHVYEHNGGEVDQKYLDDSGDSTVRLKQHIRETQETAHRLIGCLAKMTRNLDLGFHELFPPIQEPIELYQEKRARIAKHSGR